MKALIIQGLMDILDFSLGSPIEVGSSAPRLTAINQEGASVDLESLYNTGDVLFFFFPMAETSGCTAQACSLRDHPIYPEGGPAIQIVGISSDAPEKLLRFKKSQRLPYLLLSDTDHRLSKAFGVPRILGLVSRQSYLVRGGVVKWRTLSAGTSDHAEQVRTALKEIA